MLNKKALGQIFPNVSGDGKIAYSIIDTTQESSGGETNAHAERDACFAFVLVKSTVRNWVRLFPLGMPATGLPVKNVRIAPQHCAVQRLSAGWPRVPTTLCIANTAMQAGLL